MVARSNIHHHHFCYKEAIIYSLVANMFGKCGNEPVQFCCEDTHYSHSTFKSLILIESLLLQVAQYSVQNCANYALKPTTH